MTEKDKINWLKQKLRRISYQWPPRLDAKRKYKVRRGVYICAHCKHEVRNKDMHMDHIEPVINPKTGFVDWNTFIDRLFCDIDGWQVLHKSCHSEKTIKENIKRRGKKKVSKKK